MRRLLPVLLIGLAAAGCGGGGKGTTNTAARADTNVSPSQVIQLSADKSALKFDKDSIDANAGTIRLVMANPSGTDHNVAVKGNGVDEKGPVVGKGGQSIVTVTLKPGEYTFYCSVDAHEQAGMKGTLRVG